MANLVGNILWLRKPSSQGKQLLIMFEKQTARPAGHGLSLCLRHHQLGVFVCLFCSAGDQPRALHMRARQVPHC